MATTGILVIGRPRLQSTAAGDADPRSGPGCRPVDRQPVATLESLLELLLHLGPVRRFRCLAIIFHRDGDQAVDTIDINRRRFRLALAVERFRPIDDWRARQLVIRYVNQR